MRIRNYVSAVAALASIVSISSVSAGSIVLDGLGGPVTLQSKDLSGSVFDGTSPFFEDAALTAVTSDIAADGIQMDRIVTFALADTDDGLAFLTIIDDITQTGNDGRQMAQIGMSTTGADSLNGWINDANEDIQQFFDPPTNTQTYAGFNTWNSDRQADAFGWSRLEKGDFVSFNFTRNGPDYSSHPGLRRGDTFQFVSWNGEQWEVVANGEFSSRDQFAFSFTVIPLPAPFLLGLAGLTVVGILHKRMIKKA